MWHVYVLNIKEAIKRKEGEKNKEKMILSGVLIFHTMLIISLTENKLKLN